MKRLIVVAILCLATAVWGLSQDSPPRPPGAFYALPQGDHAYGLYIRIDGNAASVIRRVNETGADHKAEVRIEVNGRSVEMTLDEFIERVGLEGAK
jgi:hypothetical protein